MEPGTALNADQVVSRNLLNARELRDWTQQKAAAEVSRCLGEQWSIPVYAAAERSHRTKRVKRFSAAELVAFSRAFRLPIAWWFLPPDPLAQIIARGEGGDTAISGDELLSLIFPRLDDPMLADLETAARNLFNRYAAMGPKSQNLATYLDWVNRQNSAVRTMLRSEFQAEGIESVPDVLEDAAGRIRRAIGQVADDLQHEGFPEPQPAPDVAATPVVAAIVTSRHGVLAARRNDGVPPWTFIAGEVEPGERPEDAAIREVKEETGCEVRVAESIGQRVHPRTQRTMIYLAAKPTHSTKLVVGDEAELAEVRWLSLHEAHELMPDMFGPVRDYLTRTLGDGGGR